MRRFRVPTLLLLLATPASAAPPTFDPPAWVPVVNGYAIYAPPKDCKSVTYIPLSGVSPFPVALVGGNPTVFALPTQGLKPGWYTFHGVAASATGEQASKPFSVNVEGEKKDEKKDDDKKIDPPVPAGPYWLIVIEETSERTPDAAKVLGDAAYWLAVRARGHKYRFYDKDSKEAKDLKYVAKVAGVGLPALLVLDAAGDVVGTPGPLPKTTAGIDALIGGAK